ncbi:subtilase cytotoxin subunit B [Escherichia coli]|uniref:subtilase family AB5 toxin binding subunit n=1 Tax=Escherichia coli TaxID=562 RepID=UPI001080B35D|nr:subtilase family AB5 toxin binding subunit [Escherichia coli]EFC2366330.1 subtilase cytotoxin subunit B [Escherichia coli]EFM9370831.1 subtilase cytotoxin subunit B [Escherichia coli]EHQ8499348.1 subtilase cytotoxin subunit B [Escherichia coli]EHS3288750.1 subtilase cytotoxin subunit B [Escherichia coli]EHS3294044.1 subtilase cytotoxin subunit B [Escherichia coli]
MSIKYVFWLMAFFISGVARAEWTGDKKDGMNSGYIINKFHTGQIDQRPYFCIEAFSQEGNTTRGCSIKGLSVWGASYSLFYDQALYYYTTGQFVRIYFSPNEWTYQPFKDALTPSVIVGFSTCSSRKECFGPERKK